jgi:hypothetical protein
LGCALLFVSAVHAADNYPRRAAVLISNPHDYWETTYKQHIAGVDVAIVAAYPQWGSSRNTSMEAVIQNIHAINPDTRVFLYTQVESQEIPVSSIWSGLGSKLDAQRWWLYAQYGGSSRVHADIGVSNYVLNISPYSKPDSSGLRYNQWIANYFADQLAKPSPSAAGLYSDNVYWKPRKDGDWNNDGTLDSASSSTVRSYYRQGWAQYIAALRARMPGKLQIGNVADWGATDAVLTELSGKLDGGVMEGMIGKTYSTERTAGWAPMMARYRKTMAALGGPKLGIFQMDGSPTDYRTFRYGLASCLMDDGYFAFNDPALKYHDIPQFDEYKADLGSATSSPQTVAWKSGVYRRDFQKGIALVNPKGNGARTVDLGGDFKKISGAQDPSVNNGQTVRSVTLQDRDGIILLRAGAAVSTPEVPAGFIVQ